MTDNSSPHVRPHVGRDRKEPQPRILVIKLSALGDFIQALGPMKAIRAFHKDADITLLTTAPFKTLALDCGYFDRVWIDDRPRIGEPLKFLRLRKTLVDGGFQRVYDLQNNDRTALYLRLFPRRQRPEWVGTARGASHRNDSAERTAGHAFDGHCQTLALAGIHNVEPDDLSWMHADTGPYNLSPPYVLLVPGSAPGRPEKRWPAESYAELAGLLSKKGLQPVLLGTRAEEEVTGKIHRLCPDCIDLTGRTGLYDIAALARGAAGAAGNDTGPMHIIAATGCPALSLFSGHTIPRRHAPRGQAVTVLQKEPITEITPQEAERALSLAGAR